MPKLNANLTMLFNEVEFLDRFEKAANNGFSAVEYLFPYDWPVDQLVEVLGTYGLKQVLHNLPAGDWAGGERGIACIPGREQEFQDGVGRAVEYAKALTCPRLNCLVGLTPENESDEAIQNTLINNLRFAADAMEKEQIKLLVEPLNDKNFPGFHFWDLQSFCFLWDKNIVCLVQQPGPSTHVYRNVRVYMFKKPVVIEI